MSLQNCHKQFVFCFLSLLCLNLNAQEKTINEKSPTERAPFTKHKVLLVPFEPKLYLGEVDYFIHQETKLSPKEIKFKFRDGLNEQLEKALKSQGFSVIDLMSDTTKYKKETDNIYHYLNYEYLKVPDQENYQTPKKEKTQSAIDKGQLNVETNSDKKFMDAKISNPKLLTNLSVKYKCDLFIFINQLDIKAGNTKDLGPSFAKGSDNRKISVHYTVFNREGKEINSGLAEEEFSVEINNPKKIIDKYFSKIATQIVLRVMKYSSLSK